jgi:hypothetical protein
MSNQQSKTDGSSVLLQLMYSYQQAAEQFAHRACAVKQFLDQSAGTVQVPHSQFNDDLQQLSPGLPAVQHAWQVWQQLQQLQQPQQQQVVLQQQQEQQFHFQQQQQQQQEQQLRQQLEMQILPLRGTPSGDCSSASAAAGPAAASASQGGRRPAASCLQEPSDDACCRHTTSALSLSGATIPVTQLPADIVATVRRVICDDSRNVKQLVFPTHSSQQQQQQQQPPQAESALPRHNTHQVPAGHQKQQQQQQHGKVCRQQLAAAAAAAPSEACQMKKFAEEVGVLTSGWAEVAIVSFKRGPS